MPCSSVIFLSIHRFTHKRAQRIVWGERNCAGMNSGRILLSVLMENFSSVDLDEIQEKHYTCQLSRLRRESHACGLKKLRSHACGPISHAWLKNVSSCHLAWHNFQKYANSDSCKERKPCEKWINDNTFLAISDFWSKKHWERAHVYTRPKTSEDFGILRTSSGIFGNDLPKNPSTPRIKISPLHLRKSIAGIEHNLASFAAVVALWTLST